MAGNSQAFFIKRQLRVNEEEVTYTTFEKFIRPNEKNILQSKNRIIAIIRQYISKNSARIGIREPKMKLPFLESDKKSLFSSVGCSRDELFNVMQTIDGNDIDVSNHLVVEPFYSMCVIIASTYLRADKVLLEKIKRSADHPIPDSEKYKSPVYFAILYLALAFYGKIFVKFFQFDPVPEVMDYTIENLSTKFMIKKYNSLLEFIKFHAESNIENMWDRLIRSSDVDIIYFMSNLYNRMVHSIRSIANEYYANYEQGNRIGKDSMSRTNEQGKFYVGDVANISADLAFALRKVITRFYSETILNQKIIEAACFKTKFSKSRLTLIIQKIRENPSSETRIKEIFSTSIAYYLTRLGGTVTDIKSSKFIVQMVKSYSISNTKDEFVLGIKDLLDKLIKENLKTIVDEGNLSLKDRARTSIYIYLVLYISSTMD